MFLLPVRAGGINSYVIQYLWYTVDTLTLFIDYINGWEYLFLANPVKWRFSCGQVDCCIIQPHLQLWYSTAASPLIAWVNISRVEITPSQNISRTFPNWALTLLRCSPSCCMTLWRTTVTGSWSNGSITESQWHRLMGTQQHKRCFKAFHYIKMIMLPYELTNKFKSGWLCNLRCNVIVWIRETKQIFGKMLLTTHLFSSISKVIVV